MGEQQVDDVRLFLTGRLGAASAAAGILHREVQRRRAALVSAAAVSPVGEERPHCAGGTSPHGAVQWRHAALVLRIRIGAGPDQELHDRMPARRGPRQPTLELHRTRSGAARRRAGCARARLPLSPEILSDVSLVSRRREVQRSIAGVGVVGDLVKKKFAPSARDAPVSIAVRASSGESASNRDAVVLSRDAMALSSAWSAAS